MAMLTLKLHDSQIILNDFEINGDKLTVSDDFLFIEDIAQFDEILSQINSYENIIINIKQFTDGRHFSIAYMLKKYHNFNGEIIAFGNILRDQAFQLRRVGFDGILLKDEQSAKDLMAGLDDFSVFYQNSFWQGE